MIDETHPLLLGSSSPRRQELLRTLGIPILVVPASADETLAASDTPEPYLRRVVRDKLASIGADKVRSAGAILVADTIVVCDGEILGKPVNEQDAIRMLHRLSGRAHEVMTRFSLAFTHLEPVHEETVCTRVFFRLLRDAEIEGYARTGEGLDKAGAYAVQGIGSFAVERIEGSYANVVGLPTCEVVQGLLSCGMLQKFPP